MPARRARPTIAALLVAAGACASRGTEDRVRAPAPAPRAQAAGVDLGRPLEALRLGADEAAGRIGAFAWQAEVQWTVEKPGVAPVKATERHQVRQLATGAFEASADIDPGTGPGSETGKQVLYVDGLAYARGRWSPYRERPTDRGHGVRRFRDESFRMAGDLAALCGPALVAEPTGETTAAGRSARLYRLTLDGARRPAPAAAPAGLPGGAYDADTKRHVAFLEGRVPTDVRGELVLDAATGVPLSVTLDVTFSEQDDPRLRAAVQLAARVTELGGAVAPVRAPRGALADERRPKGVARALEAAGLRKRSGGEQREDDEAEDASSTGE